MKERIESVVRCGLAAGLLAAGIAAVAEAGDSLRVVLGRLMDKMMRDPRTAPYYNVTGAPPHALAALRGHPLSGAEFRRLLNEHGVTRIELDQLHQGIDFDSSLNGIPITLHLPYGFVASGRICASGSYALPASEKFMVGGSCDHECQEFCVRLGNEARVVVR